MNTNYIHWNVASQGIENVCKGMLDVNKFDVGNCMEKFFEDMQGFKWSVNKVGFSWNESKDVIVVESDDGGMRWVFVKV